MFPVRTVGGLRAGGLLTPQPPRLQFSMLQYGTSMLSVSERYALAENEGCADSCIGSVWENVAASLFFPAAAGGERTSALGHDMCVVTALGMA